MNKLCLVLGCFLEADSCSACLEILKVGAGGNFNVAVVGGHPYFYVIGLCRGEADIARAERNNSVRQTEKLKHTLCIVCERFKLVVRGFGVNKLYKLNLVELVLTDKASCVTACAACLCTEASGVCTVFDGQLFAVKNFIAVHIRNGNLGCGNEEIVLSLKSESVLFKLGKLACACH